MESVAISSGPQYKEYLRTQFIYKDFKDLNLKPFPPSKSNDRPKAQLCQFNFIDGHECMFGPTHCIYAHSIADIQEKDPEVLKNMNQKTRKTVFMNLGIWPTTTILSYFTPNEIIEISRVNKEAHYIAKKVFGTRCINLEKVTIRTVHLLRRAEMIKITKDSLGFFQQYKDNFFEEILTHYRACKKLIIDMNILFDERVKDQLYDKLCQFTLKTNIKTLQIENSMLNQRNLDNLTRSNFCQQIVSLKLPGNSLGDWGVNYLFNSERMKHLKKINLSSNLITPAGAEIIAQSERMPNLEVLDLRKNKIDNAGFKEIINSDKYKKLLDIRIDDNSIQEAGAKLLTYGCKLDNLTKLSIRSNMFSSKGCQYIQVYAFRNLTFLNISRNEIADDGIKYLADASYLRNLQQLYADDNRLTEVSGVYLAESKYLTMLTHISLKYNQIGVAGAQALANSENFEKVVHLELHQNQIKGDGVYSLVMSENFKQLTHLDIGVNNIGNVGIQSLSIGIVNKLKFLNVQHNEIGEDGYRILSESTNFQLLRELKIYDGNPASAEAKNALKRSKNFQALRFIS